MGSSAEGTPKFMFMIRGERGQNAEQARRVIIVGVDNSAEAEATGRAVRGARAALCKDDLRHVHAYQVLSVAQQGGWHLGTAADNAPRPADQDRQSRVTAVPVSEQADLMVLGHDHPALGGHMPLGHTTSTIASTSRHPVVAVPRGWTQPADDRRPITVAIDGKHPSTGTLGYAFGEASLRQVLLHGGAFSTAVRAGAGRAEDTGLTLAEILAGWKADYPDINVETFCYPVLRSTRSLGVG